MTSQKKIANFRILNNIFCNLKINVQVKVLGYKIKVGLYNSLQLGKV